MSKQNMSQFWTRDQNITAFLKLPLNPIPSFLTSRARPKAPTPASFFQTLILVVLVVSPGLIQFIQCYRTLFFESYATLALRNLWRAEMDYATSYSSDFTGVSHFTDNLDELKLYHLHIPYCARGTWACFEKPETLKALGKANLDRLFESHQISELRVVPATLMTQPQFSITLEPRIRWWPFRTGTDCYFIDQTGVIRHSGSAFVKAHAQSPPLEVKICE